MAKVNKLGFYRPHAHVYAPEDPEVITKQEFKDECDIHNILAQYKRTGIVTHVQNAAPRFEDLPDDIDYQFALNTVIAADDAFMALPASVRAEYNNDPGELLDALHKPENEDKFIKLGLIKPKPEPVSPAGTQPGGAAANANQAPAKPAAGSSPEAPQGAPQARA